MNQTTDEIELVNKFCSCSIDNDISFKFTKVKELINNLVENYEVSTRAEWYFQKVKSSRVAYELRIYFLSPKLTSTQIANIVSEKLKSIGYGACKRFKDTFVTVRKGKEELAVILHKLGILKELIPRNAPEKVKQNIEKELKKFNEGIKICEVPEDKLLEFYEKLVEYVNNKFNKLYQDLKDEKKAIEELKKEFTNFYIKLPLSIDEIRKRIIENIDYIVWLTICDGITSRIVDHNEDVLEYGTTRHELLAIVTKALGFIKIKITGKDDRTNKLHVVATCSNYIAQEIFKQEILEINQIIKMIRTIISQAKHSLKEFIYNTLNISVDDEKKLEKILKANLTKDLKNKEILYKLYEQAEKSSSALRKFIKNPIKAFAGILESDGIVALSKNYFTFGISAAIYTVKGFTILQLLHLIRQEGLIEVNSININSYKISIWLRPKFRELLLKMIVHPRRAYRLGESIKKTLANITRTNLENIIKSFNELLSFCTSTNTRIEATWHIEHKKDGRELQLFIKVLNSNIKTLKAAEIIVNILRKYGISANQIPKSAIIRVRRGKLELGYLFYKHGLFKGDFTLRNIGGEIERIIKSIVDKFETT